MCKLARVRLLVPTLRQGPMALKSIRLFLKYRFSTSACKFLIYRLADSTKERYMPIHTYTQIYRRPECIQTVETKHRAKGQEYLLREKRPILRVPVFLYVKEAHPTTQGKGLFL